MRTLYTATAVILAGGMGTRLRSVVSDRPKSLAEIRGKPFISYIFEQLLAAGVRRAVICTGYLSERIEAEFGGEYRSLRLIYSREEKPLGTAGALRLALPLLHSESTLVMNGDTYCEANLNDFWQWHVSNKADATILLTHIEDTSRYGRVLVDENGLMRKFEEKSATDEPGWVSAGIYLIKPELIRTIPEKKNISIEKNTFPSWIGGKFYGYRSEAHFLDIGTPESYAAAEKAIKS